MVEGTLVARVKQYGNGDRLRGGQWLRLGQFVLGRAQARTLCYRTDGNLVACKDGGVYWSSQTGGTPGGSAAMQSDGNFVVYDADGVARCWSSRTTTTWWSGPPVAGRERWSRWGHG